jgi:hypothetical protein
MYVFFFFLQSLLLWQRFEERELESDFIGAAVVRSRAMRNVQCYSLWTTTNSTQIYAANFTFGAAKNESEARQCTVVDVKVIDLLQIVCFETLS